MSYTLNYILSDFCIRNFGGGIELPGSHPDGEDIGEVNIYHAFTQNTGLYGFLYIGKGIFITCAVKISPCSKGVRQATGHA